MRTAMRRVWAASWLALAAGCVESPTEAVLRDSRVDQVGPGERQDAGAGERPAEGRDAARPARDGDIDAQSEDAGQSAPTMPSTTIDAMAAEQDAGMKECTSAAQCTSDPARSRCAPDFTCAACQQNGDCAALASLPYCLTGERCVGCTSNEHCGADGGVCDPAAHACVTCLESSQCSATSAPRCEKQKCAACQQDADCARFAATPLCGPKGACVPCTDKAQELCSKAGQVCIKGGNSCVECNANSECPAAEPVCEGNACRGCRSDNECAGAGKVCREATGTCVDCEPNKDDPTKENCANGRACHPANFTCTGQVRRSLGACGYTGVANADAVACVSDSECAVGHRCVATTFKGAAHGSYCLLQSSAPPCPPKFTDRRQASSALKVNGFYCFPNEAFTTCEGIVDFGRTCTANASCGASNKEDALCNPTSGRCTYACGSEVDCDSNACESTAPRFCR